MNNCDAIQFAGDMTSVAVGYTTAAGVAAVWFPGVGIAGVVIGGYAGLIASRVAANNFGDGVYIEITYAGFFDVEPQ